MKLYFTILCLVFFIGVNLAQTTVCFPDTTFAGDSDTVKVPISVTNFTEVGAISLDITFDTSKANFVGIDNKIPYGVFDYSNGKDGNIMIGWYDLSPDSITNGVIFNLIFTKIKSSINLQFQTTNCEITDTSLHDLSVTYKNGYIKFQIFPVKVGGKVWIDKNNNGILDSADVGLPWVTVDLWSGKGKWLKYKLTDSFGNFSFDSLQPGSYYVDYYLIDYNKAYKFTTVKIGGNPATYSHAFIFSDTLAFSDTVTLSSGQSYLTLDAGVIDTNLTPPDVITDLNNNKINIPKNFNLSQNYPNPFNPSTKIEFDIPITQNVELNVYNILGQKVVTLVNGEVSAGVHSVTFDASHLASGVYIYQLRGGTVSITKKMLLTK
jgi:hypothetical protein